MLFYGSITCMNTTTQLIVSCVLQSLQFCVLQSLQQTFSNSPETLQKISHYVLNHYDWLKDDLPVDSLALA